MLFHANGTAALSKSHLRTIHLASPKMDILSDTDKSPAVTTPGGSGGARGGGGEERRRLTFVTSFPT